MLTISSLGSCRIATPLRIMRESFGYEVNKNRNYGFCHSSSEAVQMMKFMKGNYTPSESNWNLISRGKEFSEINEMPIVNSDLYVVEISSAKRLTIGNECIQLNYLVSAFTDFFSSTERAKTFWRYASRNDGEELKGYLQEVWSGTDEQISDSNVLIQVRRKILTEEEIRCDVKELLAGLPNVIFITHVNALKPDGNVIASRSDLIETVKSVVKSEGGVVYDPTERMLEVGQKNAIEDHSDSLAHFTDSFAEILFSDWYDLYIGKVIVNISKTSEESFNRIVEPHMNALILSNRVNSLSNQLDGLVNSGLKYPKLFECCAKVNSILGEHEKTYRTLKQSLDIHPENNELRIQLFNFLVDQNRYDESEELLVSLTSLNLLGSLENLDIMAGFFYEKGNFLKALEIYLVVLNNSDKAQLAANKIAEILVNNPEYSASNSLTGEACTVLVELLSSSLLYRINLIDLDLSSDIKLKEFIKSNNEQEVLDLALFLYRNGKQNISSRLIFLFQNKQFGNIDSLSKVNNQLASIAQSWLRDVETAENDFIQYTLMLPLMNAFPLLRETRLLNRELDKKMLTKIRGFYSSKAIADLEKLQITVPDTSLPRFELDLLLAKLYFSESDFKLALKSSKKAVEIKPDSIIANLLVMRSALKLENYPLVDEGANNLINLDDGESCKIQSEVALNLSRLPQKCFVAARNTDDLIEKYTLLEIAARDENFFEKCKIQHARITKSLVGKVVDMEKHNSAELISFAQKVASLVPNVERVLLILARNLVKGRSYSMALPYWKKVVELNESNESYKFQYERCKAKLGY